MKILTSLFRFLGKNVGKIIIPIVIESVTLFLMKKLTEKKSNSIDSTSTK